MAWVAVDKDGTEIKFITNNPPYRSDFNTIWLNPKDGLLWYNDLPKGSILKLIGRELSWEDEPVELK